MSHRRTFLASMAGLIIPTRLLAKNKRQRELGALPHHIVDAAILLGIVAVDGRREWSNSPPPVTNYQVTWPNKTNTPGMLHLATADRFVGVVQCVLDVAREGGRLDELQAKAKEIATESPASDKYSIMF